MKKDIRDYLHLYTGEGCEIELKEESDIPYEDGLYKIDGFLIDWTQELKSIKPILRPLSDMTEEEELCLCNLAETFDCKSMVKTLSENDGVYKISANKMIPIMIYLLKQGFDLFGLIEAGLAIDKTTLK